MNEDRSVLKPHPLNKTDGMTKILLFAIVVLLTANLLKPALNLPVANAQTPDALYARRSTPQLGVYPRGAFVLQHGRLTLYEYGVDSSDPKGGKGKLAEVGVTSVGE